MWKYGIIHCPHGKDVLSQWSLMQKSPTEAEHHVNHILTTTGPAIGINIVIGHPHTLCV